MAEYQTTAETPVMLARHGTPMFSGAYRAQASVEARGVTRFQLRDSDGSVLAEANQKQLQPEFLPVQLGADIVLDGSVTYLALFWWTDAGCLAEGRRVRLTVDKR